MCNTDNTCDNVRGRIIEYLRNVLLKSDNTTEKEKEIDFEQECKVYRIAATLEFLVFRSCGETTSELYELTIGRRIRVLQDKAHRRFKRYLLDGRLSPERFLQLAAHI
ncbi:hypothetical protein G9A89_023780 [Geosiphon pyriformis]|nr:hypothetical protein G9A89_023780 [Geosiphon pyriformis]